MSDLTRRNEILSIFFQHHIILLGDNTLVSLVLLSCSKIVQLLTFVRLPTDFDGFGLA